MNEYDIISGILFLVGIVMFVVSWVLPKQFEKIRPDGTRTYKPNTYKKPLLIAGSILMGIGLVVFLLSIRQNQLKQSQSTRNRIKQKKPSILSNLPTHSSKDSVYPWRKK